MPRKGDQKSGKGVAKGNHRAPHGGDRVLRPARFHKDDEAEPARAIQAMLRHNAICGAVIKPNGGKIIKEVGDGVMAAFDSAGAAVECAIKVIRCLREHGGSTHTKAVVASGTLWRAKNSSGDCDVYGTPVHVSARMAEHAVKDAILMDEKDGEPVREWLERTGFSMRRTQKRLRSYPDRRLYAVSVK